MLFDSYLNIAILSFHTNRYFRINSWDKLKIPLPFSKGIYLWGNEIIQSKEFKNEILVKVRSNGKLLNAKISFKDLEKAEVNLKISEDGISPGQACVFYKKDSFGYKVLGGGWITN